MAGDSVAEMSAPSRAIGSDDLARGLVLVQASALKVVRLQLAMERRDRRVALETVDELMSLDRRINDFLDDLPVSEQAVAAARADLAAQGRALAREKFALAADMNGPRLAPERARWADTPPAPPAPPEDPPAQPVAAEDGQLLDEPPAEPGGIRFGLVAALLLLAMAAMAAAAYFFLAGSGQALIDLLPDFDGAL